MKSNIYIQRKVLNHDDITDWARNSGFTSMMPVDSLHVTVVYCKKKVDWNTVNRDQPEVIVIDEEEDGPRHVEQFDAGACVLEIKSEMLLNRSEELRALGIHSKFPDYRAHITITYEKPDDLDITKIEPYHGLIVLGPEIIETISDDWKKDYEETDLTKLPLKESQNDLGIDMDRIYEIFSTSYEATTGVSWSREKFMSRAANWTFYGNDVGFVAFRQQGSGMRKLVGVAGETTGVVIGLKRLIDEGKPVWGAVSEKLSKAAARFGFIAPHRYIGGPTILKLIMASIPTSVFGGTKPTVNPDGGVTLAYDDIGNVDKFFIANRAYYAGLKAMPGFAEHVRNKVVKTFLDKITGA